MNISEIYQPYIQGRARVFWGKRLARQAIRVREFGEMCARLSTASGDGYEKQSFEHLGALGKLMDASHASCRDLYECSCAELDELVAVCKCV